MADHREQALQYANQNHTEFLNSLKEILTIPSISTDPANAADMQRAAEWLAKNLRGLGMNNVHIFTTSRHPVVFAEWLGAKGAPTVLIYGHYDVQPVDPLDLWQNPPFTPVVRGKNLYARGASDMKGQVMAVLKAVESVVKTGSLPVNVKWIIEGEEEIGSPSLEAFITCHKDLLACDFCLNADTGMIDANTPCITYALRGLAYFEIVTYGPAVDLHSGLFGGVVHNPAQAIAELIAGMHDAQGRVTLPGFYDKVRDLSAAERAELARLPLDEKFYLKQTGAPALWGEAGYSPSERAGARPTLEVNGLLSGFTAPGSKTVLPAWATAKISMRLVPDKDPKEVHRQLLKFMETHAPKDIRWEVIQMQGGKPSISDRDTAGVRAMSKGLEKVWGKRPFFKREGGSVPVVVQMQELLGIDSILTGFGLLDDNIHAPNEKLHLPTWYRGIDALVHFFFNLEP